MAKSKRPVVIAGNWKMHKTIRQAVDFIEKLTPLVKGARDKVYLAVPYTAIHAAAEKASGTNIVIGAQNVHGAAEGAFTGEISAHMLVEAGARFVLIGHSERRLLFQESNETINGKLKRALKDGLQPILCIGETLDIREQGLTEFVLQCQINQCMAGLTADDVSSMMLAYEPVWAIGTSRTATPEIAEKAHSFCRKTIATQWGEGIADRLVIMYGGSVKPEHAKELLDQPDIDGLLVGGASLAVDSFSKIVNYQR